MFCYVMLRTLGTNVAIGAIGVGALIYGVACIGIGATTSVMVTMGEALLGLDEPN